MTDYYKPIIPRSAAEDFGVDWLKELDPMDSSKYPWNDIGAGHRQSPCDALLHGTGRATPTESTSSRMPKCTIPFRMAVSMRTFTSSTAKTALCTSTPRNSPNTAAPTFSQKSFPWYMTPQLTRSGSAPTLTKSSKGSTRTTLRVKSPMSVLPK